MSSQPANPERFDTKKLIQSLLDNFDVNKGIIKTIRLLTTSPGKSVRQFLLGDRTNLTKPIPFLLVTTAIAAFLTLQVMPANQFAEGFEKGMEIGSANNDLSDKKVAELAEKSISVGKKVNEFTVKYFNLLLLLSVPFLGLATFWFFKLKGYNYAEHVIMNSYIFGYQNIIYLVFTPLIVLISMDFIWIYLLVAYAFFVYACYRIFELKFWPSFGRSIAAIIVGTLLYYLVFTVILGAVAIFFF